MSKSSAFNSSSWRMHFFKTIVSSFYNEGKTPLLAALAARKTEKGVGRTPADQSCCERHDAQPGPGRFWPDKSEGKYRDSCDDPDDSLNSTDILLQDMILLDTISANAVMASLVSKRIPDKSKAVCDLVTLRRMTSAGQEDREERTLSFHPAFLARNSDLLKRPSKITVPAFPVTCRRPAAVHFIRHRSIKKGLQLML